MKRYRMILAALLVSLMGLLAGCSNERAVQGGETPSPVSEGMNVTFGVSVGLETYAVPAQDYEKNIQNVQVLLFEVAGSTKTFAGIPSLQRIASSTPGQFYGFEWRQEGSYEMLVVANHTFDAAALSGKTLDEVSKMLITVEPGTANKFVMASDAKAVEIRERQATKVGNIALTRLAARIDIQTTLDLLKLTKVTVQNRKTQSSLLASAATDTYTTDNKEYNSFTTFQNPSTAAQASLGQIYAFENSVAGAIDPNTKEATGNGTSLKIEATYNGANINPIIVPLPVVKRNYIYSLQLVMDDNEYDPTGNKISFNLTVLDWNSGATLNMTAEELLKTIEANKPGYSYTINVVSNPTSTTNLDWSKSATITLTTTAEKQATIGGEKDTSQMPTTISGADKFEYEVLEADPHNWVAVSASGVITVAENNTEQARTAQVRVTVKEDANKDKAAQILTIQQQAAPDLTKHYTLAKVEPSSLIFSKEAGTKRLSFIGTYQEKRGVKIVSSRGLEPSDMKIELVGTSTWLTINGAEISVLENSQKTARTHTLKVSLLNDATQTQTIEVKQRGLNENNPLVYVAHYNVTSDKKWDTNHTIPARRDDRQFLMDWITMTRLFNTLQSIDNSAEQYRLPTREQWQSILPYSEKACIHIGSGRTYKNITEDVEVAGKTFRATSDYQPKTYTITGFGSTSVNVALRFKGNTPEEKRYKSAWLYFWGPENGTNGGKNGLHIYCLNVADDSSITSVNQLDETWWNANLSGAVRRFFPAAGNSSVGGQGSIGYYWSRTSGSSDNVPSLYFANYYAGVYNIYASSRMSVRLFALESLD